MSITLTTLVSLGILIVLIAILSFALRQWCRRRGKERLGAFSEGNGRLWGPEEMEEDAIPVVGHRLSMAWSSPSVRRTSEAFSHHSEPYLVPRTVESVEEATYIPAPAYVSPAYALALPPRASHSLPPRTSQIPYFTPSLQRTSIDLGFGPRSNTPGPSWSSLGNVLGVTNPTPYAEPAALEPYLERSYTPLPLPTLSQRVSTPSTLGLPNIPWASRNNSIAVNSEPHDLATASRFSSFSSAPKSPQPVPSLHREDSVVSRYSDASEASTVGQPTRPRSSSLESDASFQSDRVSLFRRKLSLSVASQRIVGRKASWEALDHTESLERELASGLLKNRVSRQGSVETIDPFSTPRVS